MEENEVIVRDYTVLKPFSGLVVGQVTQYRDDELKDLVKNGYLKAVEADTKKGK